MPISTNDLVFRRAAFTSDSIPVQNGGRMAAGSISGGVKNNLFPDLTQAQRQAGAEHFRKLFIHVASAGGEVLLDAKVFLEDVTPGDSYVLLYPGTQSDTQDAVNGRPYGVGRLTAAVAADATVLVVDFEHTDFSILRPVRPGDVVRISDVGVTGGSGAEKLATVQEVTWSGPRAQISLAGEIGAAFDPASGPVRVSSVIGHAAVQAQAGQLVKTSAGGGFSGAPACTNRGTVLQSWTLTFTSVTDFRLDGDTLGTGVATGVTGADFTPANPAGGVYFSIPASAWTGNWSAGDSLAFQTEAAAMPLWLRRVVPAGAGSYSGDGIAVGVQGESA